MHLTLTLPLSIIAAAKQGTLALYGNPLPALIKRLQKTQTRDRLGIAACAGIATAITPGVG